MSEPELKPCPFCGGAASCFEDATHSTAWWVGCYNDPCEIEPSLWAQTKDQATEEWNTRADLPPTDAEVMAHPKVKALVEAAGELSSIVEGIQGAFNHGAWRDEKNGMRLKDTSEWVALYVTLAALKGT